MDRLTNIMSLSERQAATHGRARAGRDARVERVDVEAQVDRAVAPQVDVIERHLDDVPDAELVDLVHAERPDAVLLEDRLLAAVDVAQPDVHDPRGREDGLDPVVLGDGGVVDPEQEGDGHAVDVAR